jgi:hypothetical protein
LNVSAVTKALLRYSQGLSSAGRFEPVRQPERNPSSYNPNVSTEFLDRLASQLKVGKDSARRRAIERILDVIKKSYEDGKYQSPVEAERDFRQLVESEEE